jgi:hypothetical protein
MFHGFSQAAAEAYKEMENRLTAKKKSGFQKQNKKEKEYQVDFWIRRMNIHYM